MCWDNNYSTSANVCQKSWNEVCAIAEEAPVAEKSSGFQDENAIMELLTSQPSSEQVLSIRPSPEFQARVSELLRRNKEGELSRQEEVELERYLTLEHIVRLAKAHAYKQMATRP